MGWTWDYVENSVTWPRLKAIDDSCDVVPPTYVMTAFLAFRQGYKRPLKLVDLPAGAFERAKAENADWFANPARFFEPSDSKQSIRIDDNV
jgi:hypothetical protein